MENAHHSLSDLFEQLGLENSNQAIESFISQHQPLPENFSLESLEVWNEGQRQFLMEARTDDAIWAVPVDELDALLRHNG